MSFFQIEEVRAVTTQMAHNKETIQMDIVNNEGLAICPQCGKPSLRIEGGCHSCINETCGFSKCDM